MTKRRKCLISNIAPRKIIGCSLLMKYDSLFRVHLIHISLDISREWMAASMKSVTEISIIASNNRSETFNLSDEHIVSEFYGISLISRSRCASMIRYLTIQVRRKPRHSAYETWNFPNKRW